MNVIWITAATFRCDHPAEGWFEIVVPSRTSAPADAKGSTAVTARGTGAATLQHGLSGALRPPACQDYLRGVDVTIPPQTMVSPVMWSDAADARKTAR